MLEDRPADRRRDDDVLHRAAVSGGLLEDDRGLDESRTAAPVLLGDVGTEESGLAELAPQRVGRGVLADALLHVGAPIPLSQGRDRLAQVALQLAAACESVIHAGLVKT